MEKELRERIKEKLKDFFEDICPYEDIEEDTELIESELLDSLTILYIVSQLEDTFHITIDEKEITPEHFESMNSIMTFLEEEIG